jgi:hypothetical protein
MRNTGAGTLQGRAMIPRAGRSGIIRNLPVPAELRNPGDMSSTSPVNNNNSFKYDNV